MTGSILPGLLFHAANNSLAIWMDKANVSLAQLAAPTYPTAFPVFALSMHMVWRYGKDARDSSNSGN